MVFESENKNFWKYWKETNNDRYFIRVDYLGEYGWAELCEWHDWTKKTLFKISSEKENQLSLETKEGKKFKLDEMAFSREKGDLIYKGQWIDEKDVPSYIRDISTEVLNRVHPRDFVEREYWKENSLHTNRYLVRIQYNPEYDWIECGWSGNIKNSFKQVSENATTICLRKLNGMEFHLDYHHFFSMHGSELYLGSWIRGDQVPEHLKKLRIGDPFKAPSPPKSIVNRSHSAQCYSSRSSLPQFSSLQMPILPKFTRHFWKESYSNRFVTNYQNNQWFEWHEGKQVGFFSEISRKENEVKLRRQDGIDFMLTPNSFGSTRGDIVYRGGWTNEKYVPPELKMLSISLTSQTTLPELTVNSIIGQKLGQTISSQPQQLQLQKQQLLLLQQQQLLILQQQQLKQQVPVDQLQALQQQLLMNQNSLGSVIGSLSTSIAGPLSESVALNGSVSLRTGTLEGQTQLGVMMSAQQQQQQFSMLMTNPQLAAVAVAGGILSPQMISSLNNNQSLIGGASSSLGGLSVPDQIIQKMLNENQVIQEALLNGLDPNVLTDEQKDVLLKKSNKRQQQQLQSDKNDQSSGDKNKLKKLNKTNQLSSSTYDELDFSDQENIKAEFAAASGQNNDFNSNQVKENILKRSGSSSYKQNSSGNNVIIKKSLRKQAKANKGLPGDMNLDISDEDDYSDLDEINEEKNSFSNNSVERAPRQQKQQQQYQQFSQPGQAKQQQQQPQYQQLSEPEQQIQQQKYVRSEQKDTSREQEQTGSGLVVTKRGVNQQIEENDYDSIPQQRQRQSLNKAVVSSQESLSHQQQQKVGVTLNKRDGISMNEDKKSGNSSKTTKSTLKKRSKINQSSSGDAFADNDVYYDDDDDDEEDYEPVERVTFEPIIQSQSAPRERIDLTALDQKLNSMTIGVNVPKQSYSGTNTQDSNQNNAQSAKNYYSNQQAQKGQQIQQELQPQQQYQMKIQSSNNELNYKSTQPEPTMSSSNSKLIISKSQANDSQLTEESFENYNQISRQELVHKQQTKSQDNLVPSESSSAQITKLNRSSEGIKKKEKRESNKIKGFDRGNLNSNNDYDEEEDYQSGERLDFEPINPSQSAPRERIDLSAFDQKVNAMSVGINTPRQQVNANNLNENSNVVNNNKKAAATKDLPTEVKEEIKPILPKRKEKNFMKWIYSNSSFSSILVYAPYNGRFY